MNETKVILFDVDGVLIRLPHYFSKELEGLGYIDPEENLSSFFCGKEQKLCLEGKADAEKKIVPFLKKIGWKGTAGNYLKQQFQFERNYLDKNLVSMVKRFRKKGIKCFLCTDQEKNRAEFLLNKMNFRNIFDGHFISYYIGCRKCHDDFWKYAIDELKKEFSGIKPEEAVFFDDTQKNIDTASKFGIQAFLFKNPERFKKDLKDLGLYKIKNSIKAKLIKITTQK